MHYLWGDLIFRSVTVVTTSYNPKGGARSSVRTTHHGFLAVAHVQAVEKLVRETLIDRFVDNLTAANSVPPARPVPAAAFASAR
jgi:hypothetical protein